MSSAQREHRDVIVIGGNLRGLVSAYVAATLGHRVLVIERAPQLGGADGSFRTEDGDLFDFGLHLLDHMRSPVATHLLTHAVQGQVRRFELERGLLLEGELMPYAPTREQLPASLRDLLPAGELVDDLGGAAPTRAALSRCYGRDFTDLVFDRVLPSMRCEARHLAFGVDESALLTNVYPWFFPRARREDGVGDASRQYHDRLRAGIAQEVLYPVEGGFAGFAQGLAARLEELGAEVLVGASDVQLELSDGSHQVERVRAAGRCFDAPNVFWAAAWPPLAKLLGLPCQEVATDRMLLGSLRLESPACTDYHEILVGDPSLPLGRVTFPGRIRDDGTALVQLEQAFPLADPDPLDAEHWRAVWTEALTGMGVLDGQRVEAFDLKTFPMHFNAYGMEGVALQDADPSLIDPQANLFPVAPSMANWNTNAYIPKVVREVAARLARD